MGGRGKLMERGIRKNLKVKQNKGKEKKPKEMKSKVKGSKGKPEGKQKGKG